MILLRILRTEGWVFSVIHPIMSHLKSIIDKGAFELETRNFRKLETALRSLHEQGNPVGYRVIQPLFGWESNGQTPMHVSFNYLNQKGFLEDLTIFMFTSHLQNGKLRAVADFMSCMRKHLPARYKIKCDEFDIQELAKDFFE
jgi:hypothetical protein